MAFRNHQLPTARRERRGGLRGLFLLIATSVFLAAQRSRDSNFPPSHGLAPAPVAALQRKRAAIISAIGGVTETITDKLTGRAEGRVSGSGRHLTTTDKAREECCGTFGCVFGIFLPNKIWVRTVKGSSLCAGREHNQE